MTKDYSTLTGEALLNGIKDAVYLVLYDVYGDKFDYSFRLGKKHRAVMEDTMQVIARCAPECVVGYSTANVVNAKKTRSLWNERRAYPSLKRAPAGRKGRRPFCASAKACYI